MRIDVLKVLGLPAQLPAGDASIDRRREASQMRSVEVAKAALPSPVEPATDIEGAVRQIDAYLKSVGRSLEFRVDANTNRTVIIVRNTINGEVIRQIPNEEVLQLARFLTQGSAGSLKVQV